jgi:hypothetical protein
LFKYQSRHHHAPIGTKWQNGFLNWANSPNNSFFISVPPEQEKCHFEIIDQSIPELGSLSLENWD